MGDIAVIGLSCLDISAQILGAMPKEGELSEILPIVWSAGGVVSNTGLAIAKLGKNVTLCAKIGDDDFGRKIQAMYELYPTASLQLVVSAEDATSFSIVLVPKGKDRSFLHCKGANSTFSADDVPYEELRNCSHVHFGYLPLMPTMYQRNAVETVVMLSRFKKMGLTTSMDMVKIDPASEAAKEDWQTILQKVLPFVDFFVPSFDEMRPIMGFDSDPHTYGHLAWGVMADKFLQWGAKAVMLKLGTTGLYLKTTVTPIYLAECWHHRELISQPFKESRFASALGSGDTAIAGFLTAMLSDYTPELSLQFANAVSSCSVESVDPISGILSWDDVWQRINLGWKSLKDVTPGHSSPSEFTGVFYGSDDPKYVQPDD